MPPKKKPETKKKKGRKLAKKEIKYIVESLSEVDIETMLSSVRSFVDKEEHIHFFSSRQTVWTHVSTFKLRLIVSYLKDEFVLLYESYGQKRGGFATLLRDWHIVCGRLSCESLEDEKSSTVWVLAKEGYSDVISSDDRSAIMSSIGAACYAFFQKQVFYLIQHWSSVQLKYQELLAAQSKQMMTLLYIDYGDFLYLLQYDLENQRSQNSRNVTLYFESNVLPDNWKCFRAY